MKNIVFTLIILFSIGCNPKTSDKLFKSKAGKFQIEYKTVPSESLSFEGHVSDFETNKPLPFTSVALYKNKVLITGTETDFDGNFKINPGDSSVYDLEFRFLGYNTLRLENIEPEINQTVFLTVKMSDDLTDPSCCMGCPLDCIVPLVKQDDTTQGQTLTSDQIRHRRIGN